jgi:exodeoxyribonuclease-3
MTKFISWNVNGIRAAINKGFLNFIDDYDPDIICLQETKARPEQVELDLPQYPHQYWNWAEKKGYSGTAVFSKIKPIDICYDLDIAKHNSEGRVITLEYENYYLVNVYTPNSKRELTRLSYRYNEWDPDFLEFICSLEKNKPVIICGDLNVAHTEIDLANPKTNKTTKSFPGNAGFTDEEREGFDNIQYKGFFDTFREFNSDSGHYSWWSYRANARERNIGWRIDYFCLSSQLRTQLNSSIILPEVMGSDHAPILMELN